MLPKWHILLGIIFSVLLKLVFDFGVYEVLIVFLAAVLIDLDHYAVFLLKKRKFGLKEAFRYYEENEIEQMTNMKKGIKKKDDLQIFHTVEFHLLVFALAVYFYWVFFVFLGIMFHSVSDFVYLAEKEILYRREYFFVGWAWKNLLRRSLQKSPNFSKRTLKR